MPPFADTSYFFLLRGLHDCGQYQWSQIVYPEKNTYQPRGANYAVSVAVCGVFDLRVSALGVLGP